ncbi:MAG: RHS repeat protein [Planctomycetaceae bacterium]|jgi:YD repeat-containing protein|nr:RHS repeat protein [Planctomycetaceae bacterium]
MTTAIINNRYKIRLPRRNPYDSQGRVWKSIVKAGDDVRTTEYKYDMFGNIIETIQPDGTLIKAEYNDKGQKISATNPPHFTPPKPSSIISSLIIYTMTLERWHRINVFVRKLKAQFFRLIVVLY